ncbi:type I-D CRISPR-associated endonuclease Cas1 [Nostoc sp. C052]|uniref:type I-D CRISPR-associated endonuclease Cas1d n=1 Tax=Nostoc sp. C052 TaxID=2576902 RepID=UPI0015C2DC40|nr:type I-D CRISPR-associated endonuclease Cas1d [Nostoc sp. C052]QLE43063.1 type I-D CRISPR-associated endonuclease Cas1 [Nostoc sp. C052]
MGTVYVTQIDAFIGKIDERLTVKAEQKTILDIPLIKIEGIVVLGRATISPAVVNELLDRHICLTFLTQSGRYLGRLEPEVTKNIFVRKAQWQAVGESQPAIHLVRGFVRGKLKNYRHSLLRTQREHPDIDLNNNITRLENAIAPIEKTNNIDSLRGLEGAGSAAYFGCFQQLIKTSEFQFEARRRRPPTDPVNALLSFGYSLLRHDVQSALNIVGFDPYLGYLHVERYGRPSLALDLMEEFRPLIVDAVVLSLINKRSLTLTDFTTEPLSGAVSLTKEGLHTFLRAYEQKKQSNFKHPVMGNKCTYQEAFEIQARLLSKYLMNEIEKYPPLILK